jgi:Ca2+-transporting ATPase
MNNAYSRLYARGIQDSLNILDSSLEGLSKSEVEQRTEKYGPNELPDSYQVPRWKIFIGQFKSSIVILLLVAAVVSYFFGDLADSVAILFVILLNGTIGYVLESQAMRSMQALRKLDKSYCRVRRGGVVEELDARLVVPGDIVLLDAGDLIPADGRILESQRFEVNEASLTGESVPVEKNEKITLPEETVLADRINMVFKGTAVTKGNASVLVAYTGTLTEIGEISQMVESAQKDEIPLNEKLDRLGKKLIWLTLALILIFFITGIIRGNELYDILETAIALAVAAIPEGLPIVATISLAKGMLELAKKNVIIKKLAAVETLGETDIIITDKTGTLTENKLEVMEVVPCASENDIFLSGILCNNATKDKQGKYQGDPVEVALMEYFREHEKFDQTLQDCEEIEELPFDSDIRYMANLYRCGNQYISVAKGSSHAILQLSQYGSNNQKLSNEITEEWIVKTEELASSGLKVLGFAIQRWDAKPETIDRGLQFAGLVGFLDPARSDVSEALQDCYDAGIRVIMATGDHPATSLAIARQIGLIDDGGQEEILHGAEMENLSAEEWNKAIENAHILSRVTPRQKLEVVEYYQQNGHVVGMTGDGVNDAPALKKSDIGIAMGLRGTQVAEEAADMVLQDDAFPSIVHAIRQGRIIFGNIRNFIVYLLSCNLTEILVVSIAAFISASLPLLPLQILFLNIVTDVFPALALGMGKGSDRVMLHQSQRPEDPILDRRNWRSILIYSVVMTAIILTVYYFAYQVLSYDYQHTNSIAFFTLALSQLTHPFNLAGRNEKFFNNAVFNNRYLWGAIILCIVLLALAVGIPFLRDLLELSVPTGLDWLLIVGASLMPLPIIRLIKFFSHE